MTKEDFSRLIKKYLNGSASQEEVALIEKFYKHFQEEEPGWEIWDPGEKSKLEGRLLPGIKREIELKRRKEDFTRKRYVSGVAAAILLFIVGYLALNTSTGDVIYEAEGEEVIVVANAGSKSVFLKDGTYIFLKEGAKVSYPANFEEDIREIRLEGEAWFDVKRDTLRPFRVKSKSIITTVLGTSFNIVAHPGDNNVKVSVTSGKVQVSDQTKDLSVLMKDEALSYDIQSGSFNKEDAFEKDEIQDLKPAGYKMADISMFEATEFLAERFNKEIVYENKKIEECRLFASFDGEDTLEDIMVIICGISNSKYRWEDERIVISGEGCKSIDN